MCFSGAQHLGVTLCFKVNFLFFNFQVSSIKFLSKEVKSIVLTVKMVGFGSPPLVVSLLLTQGKGSSKNYVDKKGR